MAFQRFTSQRGVPAVIISDNAKKGPHLER